MNKAEDILFEYLKNVLYYPERAQLNVEELPEEFHKLGEGLRFFVQCVEEERAFTKALAQGDLSLTPPSVENTIAASSKALQGALRHLQWQTQQVAKGDYQQQVDFMGEFSQAFNEMTRQLADRQKKLVEEKQLVENINQELRHSLEVIDEMASIDALTGLLNRNSHELALKRYAQGQKKPVACIYIDVNGLHEVNNYLGHAAGDEMLRFVAAAMQQFFGKKDTYRIGGDEFLVFVFDTPEGEIHQKIIQMLEKVESKGYHISVGMEYKVNVDKMDTMISAAEKKMYEAKREYYRKNKNVGKEREMNRKLEKILLEKKDEETFLSLLAPRFAGVYIVDLDSERMRNIYIPDYFQKIIDDNDGNFHQALQCYIRQFVVPEEQAELCEKLECDNIRKYFETNSTAFSVYRKKDGSRIQLNIYKTAGYKGQAKETAWIFEEIK